MKIIFPKNPAIVTLLIFSFSFQSVYSQSKKLSQDISPLMARKISYYCQYNQRALALFANANQINVSSDVDKILRYLDKHLDYAEKFIINLYYNYGVEMSYFALKDAGFTIKETDIAESIWKKEQEKQNIIAEKKRQEKEQALLKRIEKGDIFTKDMLSVQPDIEIDIANMATYSVLNDKNEYMNYDYDCIIAKDGKLSLENPSDSLHYSNVQKFIYQYISDENMGGGVYQAGSIKIDGKDIPVNSYVNIKFNEQRYKHRGYLDLTMKRNKKTGQWEILSESSTDLMRWTCDEPEQLKSDLESAIYNCPKLQEMNGKIKLKIDVYKRVLKSNISDKIDLSHYFDISYLKKDIWGGEYVPIEYQVSF